jgi:signal transduction histidine kinase
MFAVTYAAALLATMYMIAAFGLFMCSRERKIQILLGAYLFSSAIWIAGNAIADISYSDIYLIPSSRIAHMGGGGSLFFFLLIIDFFTTKKMPSVSRSAFYFLFTIFPTIFSFTVFGIQETHYPAEGPAQVVPGALYVVGLAVLLASLIYGLIKITKYVKTTLDYRRRIQGLYILSGLLITVSGEFVFNIILPLIGETRFFILGPLFSVFFVCGLAYAITRYNFFDIRLVIQKSILYSILLGSTIALFLTILECVGLLLGSGSDADIIATTLLCTIMGIYIAQPLEKFLMKVTDPWFFKGTYDYADAMQHLSEILCSGLTIQEVITRTEIELANILRTENVQIIFTEDLKNEPSTTDSVVLPEFPITLELKPIGLIRVGSKKSGEKLTKNDEKLLQTFVFHAASSLSRISLHKKLEEYALELEDKVLERTNEIKVLQEAQKNSLLNISHNLQTPLALFQSKLDGLRAGQIPDTDVQLLRNSVTELSEFVYELLSLSALDFNLKNEKLENINLSAFLAGICEEMMVICFDQHIEFAYSIEDSVHMLGNETRLREAVVNVISNAIKYSGTGAQQSISLNLFTSPHAAIISIQDTGIGISDLEIPFIFNRFYRGPSVQKIRGTGLGLAIAKSIVEIHGGTISVSSVENIGTTFTITVPKI